ncbi:MAG TPA: DUF1080 domain-containing protein [Candidatus Saccharimonadales bacterium]|nr:DUF1080 domain-containing protein [Candidatus Saccharimonadales bacterium]
MSKSDPTGSKRPGLRQALAWILLSLLAVLVGPARSAAPSANAAPPGWIQLFNGTNLEGWDKWLGPASGGYHDKATSKEPALGLNHDPMGVFTVATHDGSPAIRVSGQVFGAVTSQAEFENCHLRVEYKWGEKKWPPRQEAKHYRDSGLLYWCIGEQGAGSYAWMRSVECNIMEKGVGQWWSVAGTYVDIEGRKVTLEKDPRVPYRGEGAGETCFIWEPGTPRVTTGEGITSLLDPEKPNGWNVCEVMAWGNTCLHLLNGQVVLVLTNPRYKDAGGEHRLTHGRIQLQSEAAEIYYRKVEARPLNEIPPEFRRHVPAEPPSEEGFTPLFGENVNEGWAQCGPGLFTLQMGVATGQGGMGLWWYTNQVFTNFVLRGEWKQDGPDSDSGVFVRFPTPGQDPWIAVRQGHEFEIGDSTPKASKEGTGSFYPFHGPSAVPVQPWGQWNAYELICIGRNYSLRINGQLVNTWTDDQSRPLSGYVGLQNYPYKQAVHHRRVRIKPLL